MKSKTVMDARCKSPKLRPTTKKAVEANLAGALRRLEAARAELEDVQQKLSFEKDLAQDSPFATLLAVGYMTPAMRAFATVAEQKQQVVARFEHQVKVLETTLKNYA